eukprot:scaffold36615_cov60-Phaeocystis_antarctica.AAC.1
MWPLTTIGAPANVAPVGGHGQRKVPRLYALGAVAARCVGPPESRTAEGRVRPQARSREAQVFGRSRRAVQQQDACRTCDGQLVVPQQQVGRHEPDEEGARAAAVYCGVGLILRASPRSQRYSAGGQQRAQRHCPAQLLALCHGQQVWIGELHWQAATEEARDGVCGGDQHPQGGDAQDVVTLLRTELQLACIVISSRRSGLAELRRVRRFRQARCVTSQRRGHSQRR